VVKNVKVDTFNDEPVTVHTLIIGATTTVSLRKQTKPILLLIHGFAASGACYFPIFRALAEHFVLITLDLVGMGQSSRPDNFQKHKFKP
jgi:pimeloyl-ACP methyl ester carboxylesterase